MLWKRAELRVAAAGQTGSFKKKTAFPADGKTPLILRILRAVLLTNTL
jgi:hypothetical protein